MICHNIDRIGAHISKKQLSKDSKKRAADFETYKKREAMIDKIIMGRSKTANVIVKKK